MSLQWKPYDVENTEQTEQAFLISVLPASFICKVENKHLISLAADLNAHPYRDGQSEQHEKDGEGHQQPATQADVIVRILQG